MGISRKQTWRYLYRLANSITGWLAERVMKAIKEEDIRRRGFN